MAWKRSTFKSGIPHKSRLDVVSKKILFSCCMLISLIMLFAPQNFTNRFQLTFASVFRWPLKLGSGLPLASSTEEPLTNQSVQTDKLVIQYQNYIKEMNQELIQAYEKIDKLSGLRNRRPLEGALLQLADIITPFIGGLRAELVINRGTDDGLANGQYVFADNSIIGTITKVDLRQARVRLITDENSNIPVKIGDSQDKDLQVKRNMKGAGNNTAKIPYVPKTATIKEGDEVYAYKQPGLLDVPIIIGKVVRCKQDVAEPTVLDITVQPVCDFTKIEDVSVLIMNPKK